MVRAKVYVKKKVGEYWVRIIQLTKGIVELQARGEDKTIWKGIAGRRNEKITELFVLMDDRRTLPLTKLGEAYEHY